MDRKCMYCGYFHLSATYYFVRREIKGKGRRNRYQSIGYCCTSCESKGEKTLYRLEEK